MKFLKSTILLGLVLAAPAGLTFWVLSWLIKFFDERFWPASMRPIPGMGLLVAIAALFIIGLFGKTFLGRVLQNFADWLLEQTPVVRGIYKLFKQVSDAFLSSDSKSSFKKVVMIPFGSGETESLGFVVRSLSADEVLVFVPTVPNPMSGFMLKTKKSKVVELDMSVEEAFKVILSCGALMPTPLPVKK